MKRTSTVWEHTKVCEHCGCNLHTKKEYEELFYKLNPKWDAFGRWVFKFHVVEVTNEFRT